MKKGNRHSNSIDSMPYSHVSGSLSHSFVAQLQLAISKSEGQQEMKRQGVGVLCSQDEKFFSRSTFDKDASIDIRAPNFSFISWVEWEKLGNRDFDTANAKLPFLLRQSLTWLINAIFDNSLTSMIVYRICIYWSTVTRIDSMIKFCL